VFAEPGNANIRFCPRNLLNTLYHDEYGDRAA
jgi:hypothetical protein